jgi:hypothetical protein
MQELNNKRVFKKILLIFALLIPSLVFGSWKKYKTYTPYLTPCLTCDFRAAMPADTDGDGIPDNQDSDDDNDGYADDTENKAGSDPLDPASKPVDTDGDGNPDVTDPDDDNDGIPDTEDEDDNNDGVPDSEEVDTDGDGIPDNQDSDDDNDGYADDTENKAGSDPLDPASKPNQEKLRLHKRIEKEIRQEIRKLGCNYVYNKYITEKKVPKSYTSSHNWNIWSKFDIKQFETMIRECKKSN